MDKIGLNKNQSEKAVSKVDRYGRSLWNCRILYVRKITKELIEKSKAEESHFEYLKRSIHSMNKINEIDSNSYTCNAFLQAEKRKAQRIKFLRYGDRFFPGITIPVSSKRYRTFDKLCEDITRMFVSKIKLPGPVSKIYNEYGIKMTKVVAITNSGNYICCCNNEVYSTTTVTKNRIPYNRNSVVGQSPIPYGTVFTRTILLILNGPRPRNVKKLVLNKRNSATYDCILKAINNAVNLVTGCVRKVYTLGGKAVLELADFFGEEDIFLIFGKERFNRNKDFELTTSEDDKFRVIFEKDWKVGKAYRVKPIMPPEGNDYEDLKNSLPSDIRDNYDLNGKLGKGAFGCVMQVIDRKTDVPYALKITENVDDENTNNDSEVEMLSKLSHPHIVSLVQVIDTPNKKYIFLEYVSDTTLFWLLRDENYLSEEKSRLVMRQLVSVLVYLHDLNIMHRDIKPENIVINKDESNNINIKVCDFGLATEVNEMLYYRCGTPLYMAPEVRTGIGYGLIADVWSAGATLCRMLTIHTPFEQRSTSNCETEIMFDEINYPELFKNNVSQNCKDLLAKMLTINAEVRISSQEIRQHSWIKNKNTGARHRLLRSKTK